MQSHSYTGQYTLLVCRAKRKGRHPYGYRPQCGAPDSLCCQRHGRVDRHDFHQTALRDREDTLLVGGVSPPAVEVDAVVRFDVARVGPRLHLPPATAEFLEALHETGLALLVEVLVKRHGLLAEDEDEHVLIVVFEAEEGVRHLEPVFLECLRKAFKRTLRGLDEEEPLLAVHDFLPRVAGNHADSPGEHVCSPEAKLHPHVLERWGQCPRVKSLG